MIRTETIADGITLYLGDCRDILPAIGQSDLMITDPPYGIGQDGGRGHRKSSGARVQDKMNWDTERPDRETFSLILKYAKDHVIWGGNYFADLLPPKMGWLYWQKLIGGDFSDGELAWTSRDKALKEFSYRKTNAEMDHPTQKPVELMKWCIGFFPGCSAIVDPFMGVGSTGVAAVLLGKRFAGIEIEQKYFDIACKRVSDALRQQDLFVEKARPAEQIEWAEMWGKPFQKPELL